MSSRPSSLLKVPSLRVSELYRPFKGRYSTLRRVETRNPKHTLKSIKRFLLLETSFLYSRVKYGTAIANSLEFQSLLCERSRI
jgi:hypothetical protein